MPNNHTKLATKRLIAALVMIVMVLSTLLASVGVAFADETGNKMEGISISTAKAYDFVRLEGNTSKVSWSIDKENVAKIIKTSKTYAKIEPVSAGEATVTAVVGDVTYNWPIRVFEPYVDIRSEGGWLEAGRVGEPLR